MGNGEPGIPGQSVLDGIVHEAEYEISRNGEISLELAGDIVKNLGGDLKIEPRFEKASVCFYVIILAIRYLERRIW